MSSEMPEQAILDLKNSISATSPRTSHTTTRTDRQEDLSHVASNVNDLLENLEPELARLSQINHAHAAIAPAPAHQVDHHSYEPGGLIGGLGPVSEELVLSLRAGVDGSNHNAPAPVKRLNRACDACSRRKVKVSLISL